MSNIFFDTETMGFNGPLVLLQWAEDDGPINLFSAWTSPVRDSLDLMKYLTTQTVVGFNLAFDWYQIQKWYNMCVMLESMHGNVMPQDHIADLAEIESDARFNGDCIKPSKALDLMLYARTGPYQSTMKRKAVVVRRVPRQGLSTLLTLINERLSLPTIVKPELVTKHSYKRDDLYDVVIKLKTSGTLKAIAVDLGLRESRVLFEEIKPPVMPVEVSFAPFAKAISKGPFWSAQIKTGQKRKRGVTWPGVVKRHITHWGYNELARAYANDDVEDTRNIYNKWTPPVDDNDSVLACMVGSIRWRGYKIDVDKIPAIIADTDALVRATPSGQKGVLAYLTPHMTETEQACLVNRQGETATDSEVIKEFLDWKTECSCVKHEEKTRERQGGFGGVIKETYIENVPDPNCVLCNGLGEQPHKVVHYIKNVIACRKAKFERALLNKLLLAGRFHPSATVIGSLSGRVGGGSIGGDGKKVSVINALGVSRDPRMRELFLFADDDEDLELGDFDAFEISIACRVWDDEALNKELLTCNVCQYLFTPDEFRSCKNCPSCNAKDSLRKIHALFAMALNPDLSYDTIIASKGQDPDHYSKAKNALFGGVMYGGDENTIHNRYGYPLEVAKQGRETFFNRYKGVQAAQLRAFDRYCSMRQKGGLGTKVSWAEPADYVECLSGFRRYFTIENSLVKMFYDMGDKLPTELRGMKQMIWRREREQTISGALRSALLAAAFNLQGQCMRAALNHEIQAYGAELTKRLQRKMWDQQPAGVAPWKVAPMNIHDEIVSPVKKGFSLSSVVSSFIEEQKSLIPLIKMTWKTKQRNWSDK